MPEKPLVAFLMCVDKGVYGRIPESNDSEDVGFFFCLRMVTFSNRMESSGRVVGEIGVLAEKISRGFIRLGSEKDGNAQGLGGEQSWNVGEPARDRERNSSGEKRWT